MSVCGFPSPTQRCRAEAGHKLPYREAAVVGLTGQRGMDMVNPAVSRPARHEHDLKTLVRRDRNHPSVLMWSIGNEIDYPNDPYCHPSFTTMTGNNDANKPAAERMYNPAKPNMERLAVLAAMLADEVKQEDPTRPVTAAAAFPAGFSQGKRLFTQTTNLFPVPRDAAAWKG